MICDEATVFIGGDPQTVFPELNEHLRCCRGCSHLRGRMLGFDMQLRRALEFSLYPAVTVSPGPDALAAGVSSRTPPRKAPPSRRASGYIRPFGSRQVDLRVY
jgi:hypothetical protein